MLRESRAVQSAYSCVSFTVLLPLLGVTFVWSSCQRVCLPSEWFDYGWHGLAGVHVVHVFCQFVVFSRPPVSSRE